MKLLVTLFLICLSISLNSQIARLDSIRILEIIGEDSYTMEYTYDENDRLTYASNVEQGLDFEFTYNADDRYNSMTLYFFPEDTIIYEFLYDSENNLDSINTIGTSVDYESTTKINVEELNNQILGVEFLEFEDGYSYLALKKRITYTPEGRLDSLIFLENYYYGQEVIERYQNFDYDEGRISTCENVDFFFSSNYVDSLTYSSDGTLLNFKRFPTDPDEPVELIVEYEAQESFLDVEFTGPADFYELILQIFGVEFAAINYTLMNNNRPDVHISDANSSAFSSNWFYTIIVNTEEEEIPAVGMSVFPNPATEVITLDVESIESYQIYGMTGDLVIDKTTTSKTVDISNLSTGNYVVVARDSKGKNYFSKIQKF